ncbi:ATP-binding cassette domain-containing protein [Radiobacillus kanasensis]|uniref:ribosomal protection-like ABC-F family protein n=1 Tax=Radiobacillus kanasensis TaxID=2844358 RepID=UPI001E470552|nr:ABC-F family ATP-binding cassette domain-containing protein [Radiobacillus kanasensis]UFT99809.1 ATP-binding cassette domain-containing protein [Radiobacillus kanasensis]
MLITLKNIKKIMGGSYLFEDLHFEIKHGEKVGLVGRNGSGKTTIFKMIAKTEDFESGDLFIKKGTEIGYLEQIPSFPDKTVREFLEASFEKANALKRRMTELEENMKDNTRMEQILEEYGRIQTEFSAMGGYDLQANIDRVATGLNMEDLLEHSFDQLSGGEKTKAGLAKILLQAPDLLLLDEPTNHLDITAIEWLEEYLKQYRGAVCIISHDKFFLDETITKVADLENGEITYFPGNFSSFVKQKEEKLLQEFAAYQEQQKKIKKIKEAIRRLRQWANEANPPNEKLFKRAKSMERALERMEKLDRPEIDPTKMRLSLSANERSGKDVLKCEDVQKRYGPKAVLKGADLHLRHKERLAIVGNNGCGKSTLIKILMNQEKQSGGEVVIGSQVNIGYLPQNPLQEMDPNQSLMDYFRSEVRITEGEARQFLATFMFYGYSVFRKLGQLSGGERMRLKLAIFMHQKVNLLVLDEPTNHLDMESQEVLEEALQKYDGTVIGISHDRSFLNQCFEETAYLVDGKLYRYQGTYADTHMRWKERMEKGKQKKAQESKLPLKEKIARDEESPQEEDLEMVISTLEKEIENTKNKHSQSSDQTHQLLFTERLQELEKLLEAKYEAWYLSME